MAVDFISAFVDAWSANPTLASAGVGELHYDVAPSASPGDPDLYPYATISLVAAKVARRNFTKTYWEDLNYRVNVYATDLDQAATIAAAVKDTLDAIGDAPLSFDDGRQDDVRRTGEHLMRLNRVVGPGGATFVWMSTITFSAMIARQRP